MKKLITTLTITTLTITLTACGGGGEKPEKPATTATASPTSPSIGTFEAEQTLSSIPFRSSCSPTEKEIAAMDQALVDAHGITSTSAHMWTVNYLTQDCSAAKAKAAAEAEAKAAAEAEAKAKAKAKAVAEAEAKAVKDPKTYATISARSLAKVFRSPDAHVGKKYVVYAEVTQFDSGTGPDQLRADVAHEDVRSDHSGYWNEGENAMVAVGAANVDDIVQGDIVKMYVEVKGSLTYDTTMGGSMSVPEFTVNVIKRIGTAK